MREYLVVLSKPASIRSWRAVDSCIRHGRKGKGKGARTMETPRKYEAEMYGVDSLDILHEYVISKWLVFRTTY